MSDARNPAATPVPIGNAANPPTVVLPDPAAMFARRAERFRVLAPDHQLAPYLQFLADLSDAQHELQPDLPPPPIPDVAMIARSVEFSMPVLSRPHFVAEPVALETVQRLLDRAAGIEMPEPARIALARLRHPTPPPAFSIAGCIDAVLNEAIPIEELAEHVFVGAALQVHFARIAASLEHAGLHFIGDFICPVCGSPPATSAIVGWGEAERTRFCTCSLCATRWNAVRVKCLACSSTKGIHYQAIEGQADTIKAECCDECRCFVKIMAQDETPALDPIADDVASLGLDMLVRDAGYRRAGMNLFLLGF
jgi:FdhE protein